MNTSTEFVAYLLDQLENLGMVSAKRMFGGHGIYCDSVMFGLVADDTVYLKVDDALRPEYEALGLAPFRYERRGKQIALSYYAAPDEAIDNAARLCTWARKSLAAAHRSA